MAEIIRVQDLMRDVKPGDRFLLCINCPLSEEAVVRIKAAWSALKDVSLLGEDAALFIVRKEAEAA